MCSFLPHSRDILFVQLTAQFLVELLKRAHAQHGSQQVGHVGLFSL